MKNKNKKCWIFKICDKKPKETESILKNWCKFIIYDKKTRKMKNKNKNCWIFKICDRKLGKWKYTEKMLQTYNLWQKNIGKKKKKKNCVYKICDKKLGK